MANRKGMHMDDDNGKPALSAMHKVLAKKPGKTNKEMQKFMSALKGKKNG